ncbi:MAG: PIG-L family deacetylase [Candidatus Omnitrophota bacterium]
MRVLAVGAHPDDIEMQCAGTLARCAQRGDEVYIAIVTEGGCGSPTLSREEIARVRLEEAGKSAAIIGAKLLWMNFRDGFFFEKEEHRNQFIDLVREVKPDFMIVHASNDYHSDHVYAGKMAADVSLLSTASSVKTKFPPAEKMPCVYYMDTVLGIDFNPEIYVDITETFKIKRKMLLCHQSQDLWMRDQYGDSITEMMETVAKYRGLQCGVKYAEGFKQMRAYPRANTTRLLP